MFRASKFFTNNFPNVSDVLVDMEKLVGMVDYVFYSVDSQDNDTLFLAFQHLFVRYFLDNIMIMLSFFINKMIKELSVERELIK